jgi:hypothetical protein
MYLFALKNGKKKIAYGKSPADALEILAMRLSQAEMDEIIQDQYEKIHQREMQKYVHLLG